MKAAARRILGPLLRPFLRRLRYYASLEVDTIRPEVHRLSAAWHQHLPAILNASMSVGAISREQARIKREHEAAIDELRRAVAALGGREAAHIVDTAKVDRLRASGIRLALGAAAGADWIAVDTAADSGIDVVADWATLPFQRGEVAEIRATHVIERIAPHELESRVLPHWLSLLAPQGRFHAVVRSTVVTPDALRAALTAAGFADAQLVAQRGAELEVAARAPAK